MFTSEGLRLLEATIVAAKLKSYIYEKIHLLNTEQNKIIEYQFEAPKTEVIYSIYFVNTFTQRLELKKIKNLEAIELLSFDDVSEKSQIEILKKLHEYL